MRPTLIRYLPFKAQNPTLPNILSVQSHVVYGAAGNSAAVFPMRRLGANVWPINTVQFSNHTQYGALGGITDTNGANISINERHK